MYFGINAGFGDSLIPEIAGLQSLRYTEVRQDLQYITSPDLLRARMQELRGTKLRPLWIMRPEQLVYAAPGDRVELLNEPNLGNARDTTYWPVSPDTYASMWNTYAALALARGVIIFVGSISNLDRRSLTWFRTAWAGMRMKPTHVSVHRYAETTGGITKPHKGFCNRDEEVFALRDIIGNATIAVTEFGYHTGTRKRWGFWPLRPYTPEQVRTLLTEEWDFWLEHGAESAYLYQLNDGPANDPMDRYGIRDIHGHWKPAATAHWDVLE